MVFLAEITYKNFHPGVDENAAPKFLIHDDKEICFVAARSNAELYGHGEINITECEDEDIPDVMSEIYHKYIA